MFPGAALPDARANLCEHGKSRPDVLLSNNLLQSLEHAQLSLETAASGLMMACTAAVVPPPRWLPVSSPRRRAASRTAALSMQCRKTPPTRLTCRARQESSEEGVAAAGGPAQPSMSEQRRRWAASVRSRTGRQKQGSWESEVLDPPALLADVTVVMVRTKLPRTIGTVARACSCFECEDIRMVDPSCDHLQRVSRNSSCGAQYLLHRMKICTDLREALADCAFSVAFSRWLPEQNSVRSVADLVKALPQSSSTSSGPPLRTALVFGREDTGLSQEEISMCDMVCSIPIGRLQESLSVSHAVTLPLARIFEDRMLDLGNDADPWLVS